MFRCGESEVKKEGRGQEVEGNREITEIYPWLKMSVTQNLFIFHPFH